MQKYLSIISSNPLFDGIASDRICDLLIGLGAYTKNYKKNDFIRLTGDFASFFGLVLDGTIQILKDDYYGNRTITATFGTGELFAEAFACANIAKLPVDILASEAATILFIPSNDMLKTCTKNCEFHHILIRNLLSIVARKNILLNQKLQLTSRKTTSEKIMAYLNEQARLHQSAEFTIPFDRQSLADYLGVERSAMSAEISKLAKDGYIETKRSYFKLLRSHD